MVDGMMVRPAMQWPMDHALPLRVDLEVSRLQRGFIVVSHLLTVGVVTWTPLAAGASASLALLVLALGARAWQRLPPAALVLRLDATLVLLWRNGTTVDAVLCNGGYLGPWVTAIVWRQRGRWWRESLLITPDMLPADAFRRLRVHLNHATSGNDQDVPASQA